MERVTRLGNLSQMLGPVRRVPWVGGGLGPSHLPVLLSAGRGQEARAVPKDRASARNPAPEQAAHGGRKGRTCLKKPPCPLSERMKEKGGSPAPITVILLPAAFAIVRTKRERPGRL